MAAPASDLPRVRVAAVIVLDGRLVLVRHRHRDRTYHLLPGGGVEAGETLADALVREVREETGLDIGIGAPLFLSDTIDPLGARNVLNVVFVADVTGGEITDRPDDPRIEGVDLVAPDSLAGLDLRPPMARQLQDAIAAGFTGPTLYLGALWADEPGP